MLKLDHPEFLDTAIFHDGKGNDTESVCVMQAVNYAASGSFSDAVPCGCRPAMACMVTLNDYRGWTSDAERTEFLRPWAWKWIALERNEADERAASFAVADYTVRVIAARFAPEFAKLNPIIDEKTAADAADAADAAYAAAYAADAAYAAARAAYAAYAAYAAARAAYAAYAADAAARAADAAYAAGSHDQFLADATRILEILTETKAA